MCVYDSFNVTPQLPTFSNIAPPSGEHVTNSTASPGYIISKQQVTDAVKDWADGSVDNNGLLMKVFGESLDGRKLRFLSNAYTYETSKHAYIHVICTYVGLGGM